MTRARAKLCPGCDRHLPVDRYDRDAAGHIKRRCRECNADVMGGIDHFALAPLPLDEVRAQLNVVPKGVD